ncbi:MAG: helix-turn-helix domain-containing protein, partial [Pseudomonadota bacterium]
MVKQLDDLLPDHIGVPLWMAAQAWKERFHAAMVEAGHDWFAEGRVNLLGHLNPGGDRQADLVRKSGLSKQAVQQFVDTLVAAGAVERVPDPDDK